MSGFARACHSRLVSCRLWDTSLTRKALVAWSFRSSLIRTGYGIRPYHFKVDNVLLKPNASHGDTGFGFR